MDPTVVAIPLFLGTMEAERRALAARAQRRGPGAADYERRDTVTSLAMGTASLVMPLLVPRLVRPIVPGKGRHARVLVAIAAGAVVATFLADAVQRRRRCTPDTTTTLSETSPEPVVHLIDRVAGMTSRVGGPVAVVTGGLAVTTGWTALFDPERLWRHRMGPDLGTGVLAAAVATLGWDAIYYWNHRFMHESRYMWAIHVVHHSSERYNLSTALRQPVADVLGTFVPYSLLCLFGVRPAAVHQARALNLLYQYWIHTDLVRSLGPAEEVLNTPSHHRVHHGSNRAYLDRNHGSILIVWDRLFGTFRRETEPVVFGLTTNIETFDPVRVATHEHRAIVRDVSSARSWRDRLGYVVRRPGWVPGSVARSDTRSRVAQVR
jgi:sterol desaturase/sphingolipid hydroxylase (fatty acid hydroxylase superfamily)